MSRKRQAKRYRRYRKAALAIHRIACHDEEWCTYGKETPEMHEHDREVLARHVSEKHGYRCGCSKLLLCHSCQYAVDAENIAARYVR